MCRREHVLCAELLFLLCRASLDRHRAARPRGDNPGPAGAAGSTEADLAERRTFFQGEDCPITAGGQRPDACLAGILQSRVTPGLLTLKPLLALEHEGTPARDAWFTSERGGQRGVLLQAQVLWVDLPTPQALESPQQPRWAPALWECARQHAETPTMRSSLCREQLLPDSVFTHQGSTNGLYW